MLPHLAHLAFPTELSFFTYLIFYSSLFPLYLSFPFLLISQIALSSTPQDLLLPLSLILIPSLLLPSSSSLFLNLFFIFPSLIPLINILSFIFGLSTFLITSSLLPPVSLLFLLFCLSLLPFPSHLHLPILLSPSLHHFIPPYISLQPVLSFHLPFLLFHTQCLPCSLANRSSQVSQGTLLHPNGSLHSILP